MSLSALDKVLKANGVTTTEEYDKVMSARSFIPTGYKELDELISKDPLGGIPTGAITEIFGMSASMKSRFVKDIALRPEIHALYIDTENSLTEKEYNYLKQHGVDVVIEGVIENIWGVVGEVLDFRGKDAYDLIVLDSLGAATTTTEIADGSDVTMSNMLSKSKVMTQWTKHIINRLWKTQTAFVFINHKKLSPGYIKNVNTPGGSSVKFISSLRLDFSAPNSAFKKGEQTVEVKLAKSRFSNKNDSVKIKIGTDPYKEIKEIDYVN